MSSLDGPSRLLYVSGLVTWGLRRPVNRGAASIYAFLHGEKRPSLCRKGPSFYLSVSVLVPPYELYYSIEPGACQSFFGTYYNIFFIYWANTRK